MGLGVVSDVVTYLISSPFRTSMRLIGLALGITGMVAVSGLSTSSAMAVEREFSARRVSAVTLTSETQDRSDLQLELVVDLVGVQSSLRIDSWGESRSIHIGDRQLPPTEVFGVSGQALTDGSTSMISWANEAEIGPGGVVVGREFARSNSIRTDSLVPQTVEVDGINFVVVGVLDDTTIRSDLLLGLLLDLEAADDLFREPDSSALVLTTQARFTDFLSSAAPTILSPADPARISTFVAADDRELRNAVTAQAELGGYAASVAVLALGATNIAISTAAEVRRRTAELGLRRALGATGKQVQSLIVGETAMVGFLAGLAGTWVGAAVVLGTAYALDWQFVFPPTLWIQYPLLGSLLGAVAGFFPSRVAAAISPREALIT